MHSNLKIINPLEENSLFSNKNYKKMGLYNAPSTSYFNTIYKPFNTHKYSLTTLKKGQKFEVSLNEINQRNKTTYNLKQNLISQIPYPSFPNNNRIPAIYKNSQKKVKYPRILKNNLTSIYNFNKKKELNIKNILLNNNNSNSKTNYIYNINKKDKINKNKTFGGDIKFLHFNEFFNNNKNELNNKQKYDKGTMTIDNITNNKLYPNVKISNFNSILNNIIHLIEMRDEHNNSIIYTKVTNLLLEEINKLIELKKKRDKLKKYKNKGSSRYKKIKINKRKLLLSNDSDASVIKNQKKLYKSLNINSIDLQSQRKIGFDLNIHYNSSSDSESELSLLSKNTSFDDRYKGFYGNNKNYKNENIKIVDKIANDNYNNSVKENIKDNESKKNSKVINDNTDDKKLNKNNNNDDNYLFNLNNNFKGNSIFNTFIKDNKKRNEIKKDEIKKNIKNNKEQFNFSNMLNNITSKIDNKGQDNSKKKNPVKKGIPIFEQMIRNDKLINLIHEYLNNEKKEKNEEYEDSGEEENKIEGNTIKEQNIETKIKNKNEKGEKNKKEEIKNNNIDKEIDNSKNEDKNILIKELYRDNLTKNKIIERKKKRTKTYIIKKIELGNEIIKHICAEIDINKNEKENLQICMFNLMKITRKENKTKKEDKLEKKMLKPINEIIQKYLDNMQKINDSNKMPSSLFSVSVKNFLKEKLKEILNIASEDNNEEEEEKLQKEKKKRMKELEINKKVKKKLIFDNSYFFKKTSKKKRRDSIGSRISINKINDNEADNNKLYGTSSSFDFQNKSKKKATNKKRETKFVKRKNGILGLIQLNDENAIQLDKKNINLEIENKLKNEEMLDKRLQAFFAQIKELKNIKSSRDEEKLRLFIDKEIEKFDYLQEKKIEARKYNFFNDLKIARTALKNGKNYIHNKLLFHSPIIFNTFKNNE